MNKNLICSLIALFLSPLSFAGGILTNTNQSARFIRLVALDGFTTVDAAYYNPAGLVKLGDGFHFAFTNQSAFQTRTINANFHPFAGYGDNATKEFRGNASAPIIPSIQAAYKTGNWVLSGNLSVAGGGGKATFNKGLPSFESQVALLPVMLQSFATQNQLPVSVNKYSVQSYMTGSSYIYGLQMGGSYKINEMFSAYGGFRLNIVSNGYEGNITNIMINPSSSTPGFGSGEMISANAYLTALAASPLLASHKDAILGYAQATQDKHLKCTQSGWGVTPILGVNFSYDNLNIGMKYEFRNALNVENKTETDDTGLFADGVNTPHDIPGLFTVGATYQFSKLLVSAGYHYFFDKQAKMANDKQKALTGGTNEYLFGLEYQINELFAISGGTQFTNYGLSDDFQSDLSFSLDSYSVGLGGSVKVAKNVLINIGYFWTNYRDYDKETAVGTAPMSLTYSRTNKVFAAGVDFSF
ncbi:MAG: aromatic hydrocarbon degradation protein [Dysgonamonadaceae bacterium]|jgi:long-chain fatty acid transport protein|nr:aromatic hydrocarbon degradation protein [Dysgonamonadaceae bacterium]